MGGVIGGKKACADCGLERNQTDILLLQAEMWLRERPGSILLTLAVVLSFKLPSSVGFSNSYDDTGYKAEVEALDLGATRSSEYNSEVDGGAEWIIKLAPSRNQWIPSTLWSSESDDQRANQLAEELGLKNLGQVDPFPSVFRFRHHPGVLRDSKVKDGENRILRREVKNINLLLSEHKSLMWASKEKEVVRIKRTDYLQLNDPMFSKQWHLVNTKEAGHDINVTRVWQSNITGVGVVIAVVDDGLEHKNNDISQNYNAAGSYDFNDRDVDPSPNLKSKGDNTHGTKCAGLIAAVPNNSVCAVGVAHGASVAGIRMLDGKVTDTLEAQSFIYKAHLNWIYSCSWGPEDNGKTVEGPGKLAQEALELGTSHGRYGYGNVYVFASGNGGQMKDNCNFDGYANSIYTLTVGAIDEKNKMPYYAELCSSMLAVTYSNGHMSGDRTIVTTDASIHGGCTRSFSGTSAAAPIAAGMVALMLQIRNCLTWRDVQSILVYSTVKFDVEGAEWVENGAGFHHSDQHGFGLMDAYRMTSVAGVWPLLPKLLKVQILRGSRNPVRIPSNGSAVQVSIIANKQAASGDTTSMLNSLEYVAVTITLTHVRRGALKILLSSPNGTNCTLSTPRPADLDENGLTDWTFTSTRFWGEAPNGVWTLGVVDDPKLFPGIMRRKSMLWDWTLTLYGSELTTEDVLQRRSLVEEAVNSPTIPPALACPDLPSVPDDLSLHLRSRSLKLWERIVVFVLAVVGGVLMLHLLIEIINSKYKVWKRKRLLLNSPTSNVHFTNGTTSLSAEWLENPSEDYSDMEETSNLIQSFEERTSNSSKFAQTMTGRTGYDGARGCYIEPGGDIEMQQDHGGGGGGGGERSPTDVLSEREEARVASGVEGDLVVADSDNSVSVGVVSEGGEFLGVERSVDGWTSVDLSVEASRT